MSFLGLRLPKVSHTACHEFKGHPSAGFIVTGFTFKYPFKIARAKGRGHTKIALVSQCHKTEHDLSIRWYSIPELERMLKDIWMRVRALCAGLDGSVYALEAMRLVVVAERI